MKTLDEVIKAMENCYGPDAECCDKCQYTKIISTGSICLKCNLEDDALHYLREYRKLDSLDVVAFPEDENPALTWNELKTMERKPVWVEIENNDPVWAIPMGISTLGDNERMCMVGAEGGHAIHVEVAKDSINGWQAYRKERS